RRCSSGTQRTVRSANTLTARAHAVVDTGIELLAQSRPILLGKLGCLHSPHFDPVRAVPSRSVRVLPPLVVSSVRSSWNGRCSLVLQPQSSEREITNRPHVHRSTHAFASAISSDSGRLIPDRESHAAGSNRRDE